HRIRDLRVLARRPHLHEGHAAGPADQDRARGGPVGVRPTRALLQDALVTQTLVAASAGDVLVWVVWILAAACCLTSAVAVVSFADPFYSALALIGNLASLAVLYLLLSAEFVAAAQVLVYAGAIVVMFLFVIAYVGGRVDAPWAGGPSVQTVAAAAA